MLEEAVSRIVVTGSAGHLGEALMRTLPDDGHEVIGIDVQGSAFTREVGSILDRRLLRRCLSGADAVLHTATLHKPHVATHSRQAFVDTNVTATLGLLEEALAANVKSFVFTSTTSTFGRANTPPAGEPAAWVTESLAPLPKNIYGVTKTAAEALCEMFAHQHRLPVLILRTSRFFPEDDDNAGTRERYAPDNVKVNELLYRRVDVADVVDAHRRAIERAPAIGFGRYIISATTPFARTDLAELRADAPGVVRRRLPDYEPVYASRGWAMFPTIDRVYVNARARAELGWEPRHDFAAAIARLRAGEDFRSPLARTIGAKGYHPGRRFAEGPYPIEQ